MTVLLGSPLVKPFLSRRLRMCRQNYAKSKPQFYKGGLRDGWWARAGTVLGTEAGWRRECLHPWWRRHNRSIYPPRFFTVPSCFIPIWHPKHWTSKNTWRLDIDLPGERWVVRALNWFPENARQVGRPAYTWDSMIQQFCRHNQLGNWRQRAQDTFYWMNQLDEFISFTESWWTWNVYMVCRACLRPERAAFLACRSHSLTVDIARLLNDARVAGNLEYF